MVQQVNECKAVSEDRAGGGDLIDVFSLGDIRLNDFLLPGEPQPPSYPLTLAYASKSGLVQLRHSVDPELMFREYWYNSGTNESMAEHLREIVMKTVGSWVNLRAGDTVIDIGCNDGTLLSHYSSGIQKVGYDPAKNIKPKHCDVFVNDFFGVYSQPKAKIITSIAMFYDVENPVEFAQHVRDALTDDGVWVAEMHYLPEMLAKNEVDAICHEHLAYYSLSSLMYVIQQAGLVIVDAELNQTNGGSMLVFMKKSGPMSPRALDILRQERNTPVLVQLVSFARRVKENRDSLRLLLEQIEMLQSRVIGYGASTKGNTLLQYCEIGRDLLPYIADRNRDKWGRTTVGSNIPIISEEEARGMNPDYFLALPYHFLESFKTREQEFLARGGKFIVPVPTPMVVS